MGERWFGQSPMYIHHRANWEFFAVVRGSCAALLPGQPSPVRHTRRLWVFPPATAHGWGGRGRAGCRVAIFHFSSVPHLLARAIGAKGYLDIRLDAGQARMVTGMAAALVPHFERMTERSLLMFERALLDLALMLTEHVPTDRNASGEGYALRKVQAALAWYGEHMAQRPGLDDVAAAVSVSPRHLRRLFMEARGESPVQAFTSLRLERAMDRLAGTDDKLETIAFTCGFAGGSDFSRVFRKHRGMGPDAWRKQELKRCARGGDPA